MTDNLLQPSLSQNQAISIFSPTALFAAAFFGGPISVSILGALNSWRLQRISKELPFLILVPLLAIAAIVIVLHNWPELDNSDIRIALRAAALVVWLCFYWLHLHFYRAMASMGLAPRKPWVPCIAAIGIGAVFSAVIIVATKNYLGI